jgi:type III secretion protein J
VHSVRDAYSRIWVRLRGITRKAIGFTAICFCTLSLTACSVELFANLDQRQANEIVATLFRHGIPAQRTVTKNGRYTVQVDESRFAEAVVILNDNGLPKQDFASLGEIFKNEGIVASPVQERAQMIYALSQELARTVSDIDGVFSARVHLVLPENDPLRQQLIPSSASVFIRHASTAPLNELVPQVKMLVANGVAGLSYDKVSVVLVPVAARERGAAASTEPEMESFLGLWMLRSSVPQAQMIFFSLLGVVGLVCIGAMLFLLGRRQRIYALPSEAKAEA